MALNGAQSSMMSPNFSLSEISHCIDVSDENDCREHVNPEVFLALQNEIQYWF